MSDLDRFDLMRPYDPEVVRVVAQRDDAGKALLNYAQDRDAKALDLPPDAKPMVFSCRPLTRPQRRRCKEHPEGSYAQAELAFKYGLVSVNPGEGPSHTPHRASPLDPISDEELDRLNIGDNDIHDIGMAIYAKSVVGKGLLPRCPLLDSSRDGCFAALSHLAERLRAQPSGTEG